MVSEEERNTPGFIQLCLYGDSQDALGEKEIPKSQQEELLQRYRNLMSMIKDGGILRTCHNVGFLFEQLAEKTGNELFRSVLYES